jgi:hypothetical protein
MTGLAAPARQSIHFAQFPARRKMILKNLFIIA